MNAQADSSPPIEKAIALANEGHLDQAETLAQQRLASHPGDPDALTLLGGLARARGDRVAAVRLYSEALRHRSDHTKAEANLGATLLELGRIDDAVKHLDAAVKRDPADIDARVNFGTALLEAQDYAGAERELREALASSPGDALALNSLGNALFRSGRTNEAIDVFEEAARADPTLAMTFNNLGSAWREKGATANSEAAFREAVSLRPNFPAAWTGLGVALREQGRFAEAHVAHDRALDVDPAFASARFNRAVVDLGEGRFAEGFRDYRARPLDVPNGIERESLPQDLSGRRVLLLPNQGLGDELFFLRFAPALRGRGASLIYRAGVPIAQIVERSGVVDVVLRNGEPDPKHDIAVSIGDLPYLLATQSKGDLPPPLVFPVPADETASARRSLAELGPPPYIGLTWRAGTREWNALLKEVSAAELGIALKNIPATFVALQRSPDPGEIDALSRAIDATVHDLSALNRDLSGMLALLDTIDVYVAVSNTNTHLRAGTGRPSHVLVPHPPEWRWMHAGARSPWFPACALYRQLHAGPGMSGWEDALAALRRDILALVAKG
ncbi:MAG TPA: tetratricopeptide repeat protein [Alphaproteobacteria bacterium]|jgi:tetratricopeptide (TPR) repeat protein|nr:tetratricopeptide repeat protein [Alphaproteobacteria bacterium]